MQLLSLLNSEWAMRPQEFEVFYKSLIDISQCATAAELESFGDVPTAPAGYSVDDGVAEIQISGPLMKEVPAILRFFGMQATGYSEIQGAIQGALTDPQVSSIVLNIDSPGGSLSGIHDVADTINAARTLKPVVAHTSGLMASAAYWLGSQADVITATRGGEVGSIGVYSVLHDTSQAAEDAGVKVHVVRSADLKGIGIPGDEVTEEQLESVQANIDAAAKMFSEDIHRGRPEMDVSSVATGETWFAEEAKTLGLIDEVVGVAETSAPVSEDTGDAAPQSKVNSMEIEELKKELYELRALTESMQAEKHALVEERKKALISAACDEGRVTPPMKHSVDSFAHACGDDVDAVASFLAGLAVQLREEPVGVVHDAAEQASKPAMTVSESELCRKFGISADSYIQNGNTKTFSVMAIANAALQVGGK